MTITHAAAERFWSFVAKRDGACWLWTGSKNKTGYGWFRIQGDTEKAHRVSYGIHANIWPLPPGMVVCHGCHNPGCVNPQHLRLDTQQANLKEARDLGRNKSPPRVVGDSHYARHSPELLARGDRHGSKTKPEATPRGAQHPNSKLSDAAVFYIRRRWNTRNIWPVTQVSLAREFGVTKNLVSMIVRGKIWKHLVPKDA